MFCFHFPFQVSKKMLQKFENISQEIVGKNSTMSPTAISLTMLLLPTRRNPHHLTQLAIFIMCNAREEIT